MRSVVCSEVSCWPDCCSDPAGVSWCINTTHSSPAVHNVIILIVRLPASLDPCKMIIVSCQHVKWHNKNVIHVHTFHRPVTVIILGLFFWNIIKKYYDFICKLPMFRHLCRIIKWLYTQSICKEVQINKNLGSHRCEFIIHP